MRQDGRSDGSPRLRGRHRLTGAVDNEPEHVGAGVVPDRIEVLTLLANAGGIDVCDDHEPFKGPTRRIDFTPNSERSCPSKASVQTP